MLLVHLFLEKVILTQAAHRRPENKYFLFIQNKNQTITPAKRIGIIRKGIQREKWILFTILFLS
jgi:hypothetical protein